MPLLRFSLRRLLRHWRINLLVFAGITLTGALVAGLPAYAQIIAARSLANTLAVEPILSRNLIITAPPEGTLNSALLGLIDEQLGFIILDRVEVRQDSLSGYLAPDGLPDPESVPVPLNLWSFSTLGPDTRLVEGRLPDHIPPLTGPTALIDPQPVEAALGLSAANDSGIHVGDMVYSAGEGFEIHIVGIVEPRDINDERWWGDPRPFELEVQPGANEDIIILSLLMNPISMANYFPGGERNWRVVIDQTQLTPKNAARIQGALVNTQAGFQVYGLDVTSGIPQLLENYQRQLATARITLFLLTSQALIFVFYTIGMITSFMLDRSRSELATLTSRGARPRQMMALFAIEGFLLALPGAALLGPPLMQMVVTRWLAATGAQIETAIPSEAWQLALAAALTGWLSFLLPGMAVAGKGMQEFQQDRARPPQQGVWQARNLDIFLLALSILAYWQLSQDGSFVLRRIGDTAIADPLLLLGPSLLLIAAALIFLRFFPYLLRAIHLYFSQGRGLVLPFGLAKLARDPLGPSRVVLLISLAAGLTFFSITFGKSLDARQMEMAQYLAGADLRVSARRIDLTQISATPGVRVTSPAFRVRVPGPNGRFLSMLAIDPATFGQVARFPEGFGIDMGDVMRVLGSATPSGHAAAILSSSAIPPDMGIGNEFEIQIGPQIVKFEIRGSIENFPTAAGDFAIIDYRAIQGWEQLTGVNLARGEAWLTVDPAAREDILAQFPHPDDILGDAYATLQGFQANGLTEGGKRAFALNALVMGIVSVAGFLLVHYFSAQGRASEFGLLRAGGLSAAQLLALLTTEGLIVLSLGLASGTLVGLGLTALMRPFLSRVFAEVLAGAIVERIVIDWPAIGQVFGLMAGFYGLALLVSLLALMRLGLHKSLRMATE